MNEQEFKETTETWTIEALADSLEYEIIDAAATFATQEGGANDGNAGVN